MGLFLVQNLEEKTLKDTQLNLFQNLIARFWYLKIELIVHVFLARPIESEVKAKARTRDQAPFQGQKDPHGAQTRRRQGQHQRPIVEGADVQGLASEEEGILLGREGLGPLAP